MAYTYRNIPNPPEFLSDQRCNLALGRYISAWSQVEISLGHIFIHLTGIDHQMAMIVFDGIKTRDQLDIMATIVASDACKSEAEALAVAIPMARTMSEHRNKIIHAGWGWKDAEPVRLSSDLTSADFVDASRQDQKARSRVDKFTYGLDRISTITDELIALNLELERIASALHHAKGEALIEEKRSWHWMKSVQR